MKCFVIVGIDSKYHEHQFIKIESEYIYQRKLHVKGTCVGFGKLEKEGKECIFCVFTYMIRGIHFYALGFTVTNNKGPIWQRREHDVMSVRGGAMKQHHIKQRLAEKSQVVEEMKKNVTGQVQGMASYSFFLFYLFITHNLVLSRQVPLAPCPWQAPRPWQAILHRLFL